MRLRLCAFADEAAEPIAEQISALKENNIPQIELRSVDGINVKDLTDFFSGGRGFKAPFAALQAV